MGVLIVQYDVPKPETATGEFAAVPRSLKSGAVPPPPVTTNAGVPLARRQTVSAEKTSIARGASAVCAALAAALPGGHGGSPNLKSRLRRAIGLLVQNDYRNPPGLRVFTAQMAGSLFSFLLNRYGPVPTAMFATGAGFTTVTVNGLVVTVAFPALRLLPGIVPTPQHWVGVPPTHYRLVASAGLADLAAGTGEEAVLAAPAPVEVLGQAAGAHTLTLTLPRLPLPGEVVVVAAGAAWLEADPARPGEYRNFYFDKYRTLFLKLIQ